MEATLETEYKDRSSRYRIMPGQSVPVAIQRVDEEPGSGDLLDLSVSGARIDSTVPVRFGEQLLLHLESEAVGLSITISCEVQWIRGAPGQKTCTVGLRFEHHLEPDLLEHYVDRGLLERRESDRHDISLHATVRFEISGRETNVDLSNVGNGGFCFQSDITGRIGSRVRVMFDDEDVLEGRIMWQSLEDGVYLVGCQWANRKGLDFAKRVAAQSQAHVVKKPHRSQLVNLMGAMAIAATAFLLGRFFTP